MSPHSRQNGCDEVSKIELLLEVEEFNVLEGRKSMNKTYLTSNLKYCAMKYFYDFKRTYKWIQCHILSEVAAREYIYIYIYIYRKKCTITFRHKDFYNIIYLSLILSGTRCWWRSWLRHCATSQKVAGSIPRWCHWNFSLK